MTFPPDVYALKRSSLDRLAGLIEGTIAQCTDSCHQIAVILLWPPFPTSEHHVCPAPSLTPPMSAAALTAGLCALSTGTSTTSPSSATQCPGT